MFDIEKKETDRKIIMAPNFFDTSSLRVELYVPSLEFFTL